MLDRHQQRLVEARRARIVADGEGAEGVAVIALAAGDESLPLRLAALDRVLPRQFQGASTASEPPDEVDVVRSPGAAAQMLGQFLGRTRGEEGGVREGQLVELPLDRRDHAWIAVAQARDRCPAGGIQYAIAILGNQPHAFATHRFRRGRAQASVHHTAYGGAHDGQPFSVTYWEVSARRASVSSSCRSPRTRRRA